MNRYIMMGSVFHDDGRQVRILSPYFIRFEIDPQMFKTDKQLVPKILKDVKQYTSFILSKVPTLTLRTMTTEDANLIAPQAAYVGYGIQELQKYMQWKGPVSVPEIFL